MKDTTFYPTPEQRQRLVTIYRWDKEAKQLAPADVGGNSATATRRAPNPSGGLCSTAADYSRFFQMVLNKGELDGKRIVSAAAVKQMVAIETGDLPTGNWTGFGWSLGWGVVKEPTGSTAALSPDSFGHGGAFGTVAWIDPQRDAVMILMIARSDMNPATEADVRGAFAAAAVEELK